MRLTLRTSKELKIHMRDEMTERLSPQAAKPVLTLVKVTWSLQL